MPRFKKILIANRGEIALRIINLAVNWVARRWRCIRLCAGRERISIRLPVFLIVVMQLSRFFLMKPWMF